MATQPELRLSTRLQRKDPSLPVYVVIPGRHVNLWSLAGTTIIEGTANGVSFGRRTMKAWGKGTDDWFVEFTAPICKAAGLSVGDHVVLTLHIADTSIPTELVRLIGKSRRVTAAWLALTERARRDAGEHIRAAKSPGTKQRRARAIAESLRR
jgi:hypothetical protein